MPRATGSGRWMCMRSRSSKPSRPAAPSGPTWSQGGVCGGDEFVDAVGVGAVAPEDGGGVAHRVLHADVGREQDGPAVGRVLPGRALERDEAVADLVAVQPGPQAELVVEPDPGLA